jgi:3-oxoacyl-[acyl-carrier protein] reductase
VAGADVDELANHDRDPIAPLNVVPGFVETAMTEDIIEETSEKPQKMTAETPAGRYAQSQEIAHVARFLVTDDVSPIRGSTVVDGDGGTLVDSLIGEGCSPSFGTFLPRH